MSAAIWFTIGAILGVIAGAIAAVWIVTNIGQRCSDRDVFLNE